MTRSPGTAHAYPARRGGASFSIPSILAAVCLIATLFTNEALDLILSIAAIVLGLIGAVLALSPSVRGGIVSIVSILIGVVAVIVSILQLIF